jgi:hypothetical protein
VNADVKKTNIFWKGIGWVFKIILLMLVVVILIPTVYFAWRAGQPMELPAFGGESYYQVIAERMKKYEALETEFQREHPNKKIVHGMCITSDLFSNTLAIMPIGYATVSSYLDAQYNLGGVVPKSVMDIMPAWWSNYEAFSLGMYQYIPQGPVPYCRIVP